MMSHAQDGSDLFLRNSRDIDWIKKGGRRVSTAWFNLLIRRADGAATRVAIIVGRRFGTAVRRNRAKRIFRELGRLVRGHLAPGYRFLVFPKRECLTQQFAPLRAAWIESLKACGLLHGDMPT
jgi:ribonuclease P protein component